MNPRLKSFASICVLLLCIGFGGYLFGKKVGSTGPQILEQHPGESPSILFLRAEFPDHRMDMLNVEWQHSMKRLTSVASEYWSKQTYNSFKGFDAPIISPIYTLENEADSYIENLEQLYRDVEQIALKDGVDTKAYDHVVLSYPKLLKMDKAWGTPGRIWIPGRHPDPYHFSHEVGHSFGLGHVCSTSGKKPELDKEILPSSDPMFLMGGDNFPGLPLPLPMRRQLQVITDAQVPEINSPGTYRLYACDADSIPADKSVGFRFAFEGESKLWLSYYPSLTIIDTLTDEDRKRFEESVFLHLWDGLAVATLDSTPKSSQSPRLDAWDSGIPIGTTFRVPGTSFDLTPTAIGTDESGSRWIEVSVSSTTSAQAS